jgi:uncharacterized protein YecE (DUF72 family)
VPRSPSVLLGTASWADKPLIESGKFYPASAKSAEARLRYYATQFPLVEVDSTYYGLPQPEVSRLWVDRTPAGFTFDVKAYSLFTDHPSRVDRLPKDVRAMLPAGLAARKNLYRADAPDDVVDACWRTFRDGVLPLHEAGKLGVAIFQFPKWVFPNRATWRYFGEIQDRLGPIRAAFEFRNETWMAPDEREQTLSRLGDLGFSYVCVDEPQGFQSSVPPVVAATSDIGFVRFHGRNAETWNKRTATSAERFDYWYTPDELDEWTPGFRALLREAGSVHAVMNTNASDQGPANLRVLEGRLLAAGIPVVPALAPATEP